MSSRMIRETSQAIAESAMVCPGGDRRVDHFVLVSGAVATPRHELVDASVSRAHRSHDLLLAPGGQAVPLVLDDVRAAPGDLRGRPARDLDGDVHVRGAVPELDIAGDLAEGEAPRQRERAQLLRNGVTAVADASCVEAARSLGMNKSQAMYHVILPQAVTVILPPIGNEFVALLKDSSLVSILAVADLLRRGRE